MQARTATLNDSQAIARIYNEGIADRIATFETQPRSPKDIESWFDGKHPVVVVEDSGGIIAFASTSTYRPRACYAGIAEYSVYVARQARDATSGGEAGDRRLDLTRIEAAQEDPRPLLEEPLGGGQPDAAAAPADQNPLAPQSAHSSHPCRLARQQRLGDAPRRRRARALLQIHR